MSYSQSNINLSERILLDASCFLSSSTSQKATRELTNSTSYSHQFSGNMDGRTINIEPAYVIPKGLQDFLNEAESVSRLESLLSDYYQVVNKQRFPVELEYEDEQERELREQIFDVYDNSPVLKYFGYRQGLPNFSKVTEVINSEDTEVFTYSDEDISEMDVSTHQFSRNTPQYRDCDYDERKFITQILTEEAVFLFTQSTLWSRLRKPIDAISDIGAPKLELRPSLVNHIDIDIDINIDVGPLLQDDASGGDRSDDDDDDDFGKLTRAKALMWKIFALKGFLQKTGVGNWVSNISPVLIKAVIQEQFLADVLSASVQLVADP